MNVTSLFNWHLLRQRRRGDNEDAPEDSEKGSHLVNYQGQFQQKVLEIKADPPLHLSNTEQPADQLDTDPDE